MAAIEKRTSEDSDATGQESLYRSDPGYGAVVAPWDECGRVIRLEDAEGVQ